MSSGVRLRHLNLKLATSKGHDLYAACLQGTEGQCEESDFLFFNNKRVRHFSHLTSDSQIIIDLDQARKSGYSKIIFGSLVNSISGESMVQIKIDSILSEQEGYEKLRTFAIKESDIDLSSDQVCEMFSAELQIDKGWKIVNRYTTFENAEQYLKNLGLDVS